MNSETNTREKKQIWTINSIEKSKQSKTKQNTFSFIDVITHTGDIAMKLLVTFFSHAFFNLVQCISHQVSRGFHSLFHSLSRCSVQIKFEIYDKNVLSFNLSLTFLSSFYCMQYATDENSPEREKNRFTKTKKEVAYKRFCSKLFVMRLFFASFNNSTKCSAIYHKLNYS